MHVLDDAVVEAPGEALVAGHVAAGEQELGGAAVADQPRQHRAGAHVGAGQADAGEQEGCPALRAAPKRMSLAIARIAPAPAQTPSTAAMIGCGQERIARTRSPVIRVKRSRPSSSILIERTDDLMDVAARAEIAARAAQHDDFHLARVLQCAERVAQLVIAVEGQRILALRAG